MSLQRTLLEKSLIVGHEEKEGGHQTMLVMPRSRWQLRNPRKPCGTVGMIHQMTPRWKLKLAIYLLYKLSTAIKGDRLKECHWIEVPFAVHTQKDQAKNLWLIFTDRIKVKFILKDTSVKELTGCWCNICKWVIILQFKFLPGFDRNNEQFTAKHGKRKAFLTSGNSSCRQHIRQHYPIYQQDVKKKMLLNIIGQFHACSG